MNTFKRQHGLARFFSFACVVGIFAIVNVRGQNSGGGIQKPQLRGPYSIPLHIVQGEIIEANGTNSSATLSNVVEYLEFIDPNSNIVLPSEIGQIKIGDLRLHGASVDLVLEAASAASGGQFIVSERGSPMAVSRLFFISKAQEHVSPASERTVEALNLTGYLSYMNMDVRTRHLMAVSSPGAKASEKTTELDEVLAKLKDILIRTIEIQRGVPPWTEKDNSKKPEITFYADADLLVVVGTPEQLETARKIVNALPGGRGNLGRTTLPSIWQPVELPPPHGTIPAATEPPVSQP